MSFSLYLLVCLSLPPKVLGRGELCVHMGVGVLVLGGWVGDYSFNELRPGKERGEKKGPAHFAYNFHSLAFSIESQ